MLGPPRRNRHANQRLRRGGQGQNRTADTRIFSRREGASLGFQAEELEGVFSFGRVGTLGTEPIPNLTGRFWDLFSQAPNVLNGLRRPGPNPDRTVADLRRRSEPRLALTLRIWRSGVLLLPRGRRIADPRTRGGLAPRRTADNSPTADISNHPGTLRREGSLRSTNGQKRPFRRTIL